MRFPRVLSLCCAALLLALGLALPCRADSLEDAARALARDIAEKTGAGAAIALSFQNLSSLGNGEVTQVRQSLESELRHRQVQLVPAERAVAEVKVTLAENPGGYLWVAEVRQGNSHDLVMRNVARTGATAAPRPVSPLVIQKTLLWTQGTPFLDLALPGPAHGDARMLVLEAGQVSLYHLQGGRWQVEQSAPVLQPAVTARDLRGRLWLHSDLVSFDAYLPGVACSGTTQPTLSLSCHASDDPWPLGPAPKESLGAFYGAARNFFSGALTAGHDRNANVPPFYSAAPLGSGWAFAGVDGQARWMNGSGPLLPLGGRMGSELSGVASGCGAGAQVLATGRGDWDAPDSVQAYELAGRDLAATGPPVSFDGPVLALWTETDTHTALAVSYNLKTGSYEAHRLAITCSQ
ncbi:MAG TPA: hypothetical protein VE825_11590 [Terriglobales bacterium]|nr:hypothetical protein [Terriglobales bacterium]